MKQEDVIQLSDKECQLIVKCLNKIVPFEDVLDLFLKYTNSDEFTDDELCDLVQKLTKIYPYRGM